MNRIIFTLLFVTLCDVYIFGQNNRGTPFDWNVMMREIQTAKQDSLNNESYFSSKLPYFSMFYDILDEEVRNKLMKFSYELMENIDIRDRYGIKAYTSEFDFYINTYFYFNYITDIRADEYMQQKKKEWYERVKDSTLFHLTIDSVNIPVNDLAFYCITDDSVKKNCMYKLYSTSTAVHIPSRLDSLRGIIILKYKKNYFKIYEGILSAYKGTESHCEVFTKIDENIIRYSRLSMDKSPEVIISNTYEKWGYMVPCQWFAIEKLKKHNKSIKKSIIECTSVYDFRY